MAIGARPEILKIDAKRHTIEVRSVFGVSCLYFNNRGDGKLNPDNVREYSIILDLQSTTKEEAIQELIRRAEVFESVNDKEELERSVIEREHALSTGFGRGVAVSHGETADLDRVVVAFGLSASGIEYQSMDGKPVHILFLVVNPSGECTDYLDVLSALTRVLRLPELRERLRCCTCPEEVHAALTTAISAHCLG